MLTLIVLACLTADPSRCREDSVPTNATLPIECMQAMTEWAMQHPWMTVQRWTCRMMDRDA